MDNAEIVIYRPYGRALGDCWLVLNYYIGLANETSKRVYLSDHYLKKTKLRLASKLYEILPLLNYKKELFELCQWEPTELKINWTLLAKYPVVPSHILWKKNHSKKICYQFDAKSQWRARFSSPEIEQKVLFHAESLGYTVTKLGLPTPLKNCLEDLAESELFLGVDSGMCNAAAACGIPILFCRNTESISKWDILHRNKHFILTNDYIELINEISNYNKHGLDYYIHNIKNKEYCKWL